MNEYNKLLREVDNLREIYLPKLTFINNSGDSCTIHKSGHYLNIINARYELALSWHNRGGFKYNDVRDIENLNKCKEYISEAIEWLKEIAIK